MEELETVTLDKNITGTILPTIKPKQNKKKKRYYDEVSFEAVNAGASAKGFAIEKFLKGYDFSSNYAETEMIDEIEPEKIDNSPLINLNNEIVKKVNARKRNKKKVLYQLLKIDGKDLNRKEFRVLSKYEYNCHIANDEKIQNYLNEIHSTLILKHDFKNFNKRETIISYLDDSYVWGIERASKLVAREYLDDNLFNEWNGEAFDLSVRNFVRSKEIWKNYKPYCKKQGFKPRQIATISEFNKYLNIHCPALNNAGYGKQVESAGLVSDYDQIDLKKRTKVNTFIRRKN
ncbi:hypothetical protein [Lentilactobacillus kefiri]|uniref:hypothetical protein n=1 Tax=Lentilactobacillus kefiri TaxID=33962 RepID=UPI002072E37A|nr:hypothetical protein [Lentilactobacillus kefiri]